MVFEVVFCVHVSLQYVWLSMSEIIFVQQKEQKFYQYGKLWTSVLGSR